MNHTILSDRYFISESFWHKVGRYMLAMGVMALVLGAITGCKPECAWQDEYLVGQTPDKRKDIFLECLSRTQTNVTGAKYQALDEVVEQCRRSASEMTTRRICK